MRLDTFYENMFVKTYFLFLDLDENDDSLVITRHTVPYFVPLGSLTERFLNLDIKV
jgi:hypothetical protein